MQYLIQANGNEGAGTVCEISQKHPVIAGGWVVTWWVKSDLSNTHQPMQVEYVDEEMDSPGELDLLTVCYIQ